MAVAQARNSGLEHHIELPELLELDAGMVLVRVCAVRGDPVGPRTVGRTHGLRENRRQPKRTLGWRCVRARRGGFLTTSAPQPRDGARPSSSLESSRNKAESTASGLRPPLSK